MSETRLNSMSLISRRDAVSGLLFGTFAAGLTLTGSSAFADSARLVSASKAKDGQLAAALKQAQQSADLLKKLKDYTASFFKEEVVGGVRINQQMQVKIREQPFSVYLRFMKELDGREVIYVEGKNDGKILVHGSGIEKIAGTLKLAPDHKKVMEENRYPTNMVGLSKMMGTLLTQWESELALDDVEVKNFPSAKIGTTECKVIQSTHAKKTEQTKFHVTRLYLDRTTSLPVRVEQLDFPAKAGEQPTISEQYTYLDLKTNVGLTDADFDTKNKSYNY